ncbi:hypothetical protein [Streptomyces sp. NPDC056361]|uniref:hypothetical protein n=1 Tax=Streptomyces sp. NPDC056361 TaxID=3345795 RepID=UPI0035D8EDD5
MSTLMSDRPCAKVCRPGPPGSVELLLLRRVLGLCLRLSVRLSADCPSPKGG